MDLDNFLEIFGGVYEHSEWVAQHAYETGLENKHNSVEGLSFIMKNVVDSSPREQKLNLLRAHPDLAGKLSINKNLTLESALEQDSANLNNCNEEEFLEFKKLNYAYKKKFNFPFIFAVRGYNRTVILEIFNERINNSLEAEFVEAIRQVHRIALLRLKNIK